MNSSNEHYKNDPFNKSGPPNRRIGDALIESVSGDIADLQRDPRDMHLQALAETVTRDTKTRIRSIGRQKIAEQTRSGAKAKEAKRCGAEKKEEAGARDRPAKPGEHDEKLRVS